MEEDLESMTLVANELDQEFANAGNALALMEDSFCNEKLLTPAKYQLLDHNNTYIPP